MSLVAQFAPVQPDLAKRDKSAHDFSSMHRRRVVIDRGSSLPAIVAATFVGGLVGISSGQTGRKTLSIGKRADERENDPNAAKQ